MKTCVKSREDLKKYFQSFNYCLLYPIPYSEDVDTLDILIQSKDVQALIRQLKMNTEISSIQVSNGFQVSKVVLEPNKDEVLTLNFVHRFVHQSLTFLDIEKVLEKRVMYSDAWYIPSVEHIFEYKILDSYLNRKGIGKASFQYFNEFHILVQEDLIEYFNDKFGTSFTNLYQLTDFDDRQRLKMIDVLKQAPANRFLKHINIRWNNFLGSIRS